MDLDCPRFEVCTVDYKTRVADPVDIFYQGRSESGFLAFYNQISKQNLLRGLGAEQP